jgi:hypothetical protein
MRKLKQAKKPATDYKGREIHIGDRVYTRRDDEAGVIVTALERSAISPGRWHVRADDKELYFAEAVSLTRIAP